MKITIKRNRFKGCITKAKGITAVIDDSTPVKWSTIHLTITGRAGAKVTAICHYKSKDTTYNCTIEKDGKAVIQIPIGAAMLGFKVRINVLVGKTMLITSFIPQ